MACLPIAHSVLFFRDMQIGAYIALSSLPVSRNCMEANYSFEFLLRSVDRGIGDYLEVILPNSVNTSQQYKHNGKEYGALENGGLGPIP